jgi:small subunit ribosomal protein S6
MRIYEELFIVKPDLPESDIDALVESFTEIIVSGGGKIQKVDKWGKRKLAYMMKKFEEGFYVLIVFEAPGSAVRELERRLRVSDPVIKYLTVRIDEELRRVEKKRKKREARAARRPPAPPAPEPAAPAEPAAATPAAPAPGAPEPKQEEAKATAEAES